MGTVLIVLALWVLLAYGLAIRLGAWLGEK